MSLNGRYPFFCVAKKSKKLFRYFTSTFILFHNCFVYWKYIVIHTVIYWRRQQMNKIVAIVVVCGFTLAACGAKEETAVDQPITEKEVPILVEEPLHDEGQGAISVNGSVADEDQHIHEPDEHTTCEMCNMHVYEKNDAMGMFSTKAIKKDGTVIFYDDIGCLLNDEVAKNETNEKYVRDFNNLKWAKVEDVTIVKTTLKTPMNWGYAYFIEEQDARSYIGQNEGAYIEKLETIKVQAKMKYEQKMKQQGKMGDMPNNE
ncbi:hypothetical protein EK386_11430 [Lysinibacillus antri]|uniref:Uncharacterized protein n=2 Tax=Lysinibacillus antri TaxID=2498145 RepID=A0A3S0R5S3_9BACI|nr:hypothetical protein EK386_11430 [Lysinibacillus antri]